MGGINLEIKTVSLIGLGALGVMLGGQMARHMPQGDFRVIVDESRLARYRRDGIFANGKKQEFHYILPGAGTPPPDLLIFGVKYTGLTEAIQMSKSQVGKNTLIISLLNGVVSEEEIAAEFGSQNVLYCVAQGMDATKTGNKLAYKSMGKLVLGEGQGLITARVRAVGQFLERTGVCYELSDKMRLRQWSKLMLNVGVNQAAMVYKTNYAGLQRPGVPRQDMLAAMREVLALAPHVGVALQETDIDEWMRILDTLAPEGTPSMRQDLDAGRPTEVALFAGTVCRLGQQYGVPTPVNNRFYAEILRLQQFDR